MLQVIAMTLVDLSVDGLFDPDNLIDQSKNYKFDHTYLYPYFLNSCVANLYLLLITQMNRKPFS